MGLISFVARAMGTDDLRKEAKDLIDELLGTDPDPIISRGLGSKGTPRYNMEGNILYDVHRGTTWMYDPESKSFNFIPRKLSGPQYSLRKMQLEEEIRLMRKKMGSKLGKKESKEKLEETGEEILNRMREALDLMNPYKPQ